MRRPIMALIVTVSLAGTLTWAQASSPQQSAPAAQPDQSSTQKKQAESECMKWAKQQAGVEQPSGSPQQSSTGNANQPGATPDTSAASKPAENSTESTAASAAAGAANQLPGALGGAANSKYANLVKDAYAKCMEKKGYPTK